MIQGRVPAGKMLLELPAGMLDDDKGDFVGTAVREVLIFLSFAFSTPVLPAIWDIQCSRARIKYSFPFEWVHYLGYYLIGVSK